MNYFAQRIFDPLKEMTKVSTFTAATITTAIRVLGLLGEK